MRRRVVTLKPPKVDPKRRHRLEEITARFGKSKTFMTLEELDRMRSDRRTPDRPSPGSRKPR